MASGLAATSPSRAADPPPSYPHKSVKFTELGTGPRSYWLFEPAEPKPDQAPVVVFNHGWFAVNPAVYGAWIEHMARKGRIVIAPRYQRDWSTPPANFLPNGLTAVRDALDVLATSTAHVRPDRSKFALVGHSAGGNLAAQMAAIAAEADLPEPKAVVAVFPGEVLPIEAARSGRHPGEDAAGRRRRAEGPRRRRPAGPRNLRRDHRDPQRAEEVRPVPERPPRLSPLPRRPPGPDRAATAIRLGRRPVPRGADWPRPRSTAFDTSGFWRLADLTLDAAFAGKTLDEATDRGDAFRHLGYWSDGRPVTPPIVSDDLAEVPRVFPAAGIKGFGRLSAPTIAAPRDPGLSKASVVAERR